MGNWWRRGIGWRNLNKIKQYNSPPAAAAAKNYCIVDRNGTQYCENTETYKLINKDFKNSKLITISPGGFKGFYMLGVVTYIKTFFDLDDDEFIFSGSSAGSWNCLVMSYKGDPYTLYPRVRKIIKSVNDEFKKKTIQDTQKQMRAAILEKFDDSDFDYNKIYIGITTNKGCDIFSKFSRKTIIYNYFQNLDDVIDACMASSHIPFITGGHKYRFRNIDAYDGGFSKYPYLKLTEPYLKITPNIWGTEDKKFGIERFTTLFSKRKYDLIELFDSGFLDSFENHATLASLFKERPPPPPPSQNDI